MRQDKLRYNLQFFAEQGDTDDNSTGSTETSKEGTDIKPADGTGNNETSSKDKEAAAEPETLEDILKDEKLNAQYQEKLNAAVSEALKKAEAEKAEAERQAKLSPEEREAERQSELDRREEELNKRELQMKALEKLEADHLPKELAAILDYGDDKAMEASIKTVSEVFNAAVQAGVESKLAGDAPLKKAPQTEKEGTVDREKIRNAINGIY